MTEGSGTSPLPSPAGQPVPQGIDRTQTTGTSPTESTDQMANEENITHKLVDTKHLPNQAGLDSSQSDSLSQDKSTNLQNTTSNVSKLSRPNTLRTDGFSNDTLGVTKQKGSNSNSQVSSGASPNNYKNMEQASTRSSSTSSYVMVSGIEGRRVDSGYHSVGVGDQVLRSTEEERKAPIAEITEFSITPEEGSEAPTPEFIFTSATPPSLPQSPLAEEDNSNNLTNVETQQSSVKRKPANLTLNEGGDANVPVKGRGLVSSHDSLSPRRLRPKNVRRKHTVSGVTEEARAVLEQMLRRSYSQNDASPRSTLQNEYMGISEMTVIEERPRQPREEEKPLKSPRSPMTRNKSYQAATGHLASGGASGLPPKSDSFDFMCEDDDDLTSHSPVSKTNSIISGSSRSSSFRHRYVVRPLPSEDVEAALKGNLKKKTKLKRRPRKDSTGSTSSGSDFGAFDTTSGVRRKKSFFKRASERLRQSFRIKKERHKDLDDFSDTDKNKVQPQKRKHPKNKKPHSDSLTKSPSGPSGGDDIVHTHVHRHIHQEQNKVKNGSVVVLHTEDIDVVQDSCKEDHHLEVKLHTKESWPKEKEKKSLWDNILHKIRKGSHKLQRKSSSKDKGPQLQERSKSADALQYVSVQTDNTAETLSQGGDRKRRITHSFREIFGGNRRKSDSGESKITGSGTAIPGIVRPALPPLPPLPPPPPPPSASGYNVSDGVGDAGRHDLRQQMRLDGLIATRPDIPPGVNAYDVDIDVDRYDRVVHTRHGDQVVPVSGSQHQNYMHLDSFDDVDNTVSPELRRTIEDNCNKPFELRTDTEKEELYEKIAEQLAMIADSYDFNSKFGSTDLPPPKAASLFAPAPTPATAVVSPAVGDDDVFSSSVDPHSPTQPVAPESGQGGTLQPPEVVVEPGSPNLSAHSGDQSPAVEGAVGGVTISQTGENLLSPNPSLNYDARRAHSIERRIGAILRDKGDKHQADVPDLQPIVTEIVRGASYNKFQKLLHSNIGQEPGWQQLAVMFKLTQNAVQLVGMGTAAALHIKEMSLRYFEDKFASWIVGQGGWESMVSDTDLSSEVD